MTTEELLEQLLNANPLSQAQAEQFFTAIIHGKLSSEQLAASLMAFKLRGETPDEICGAVNACLTNATPFPAPDYDFADIVGTGGDNANTINISTASAIIAASCGVKIAKHGNRSVSSHTGASDVLTELGVNINMSPTTAKQALDEIGLCFLFAPQYHQGFKYAASVRQTLKTRTIFNILGPLINPARPKRQLLGVYSPDLIKPYAKTLAQLGCQHAIVVHGAGLDEVAIHGSTEVAEIIAGDIHYYRLSPHNFGFNYQPLDTLRGGKPAENAQSIRQLLQGKGKPAHIQAVAMNTALLLTLFGKTNLRHNTEYVLDTLASGAGFELLTQLTQYS